MKFLVNRKWTILSTNSLFASECSRIKLNADYYNFSTIYQYLHGNCRRFDLFTIILLTVNKNLVFPMIFFKLLVNRKWRIVRGKVLLHQNVLESNFIQNITMFLPFISLNIGSTGDFIPLLKHFSL